MKNSKKVFSLEHRERISASLRGRKLSVEHRANMSKNNSKHWLGKKRPEQSEIVSARNIKLYKEGRVFGFAKKWKENPDFIRGKNHPAWIKDRNKLKKLGDAEKDRRSSACVLWRKAVWSRDSFKCRIANDFCIGRIEAHHILGWAEYPELRYEINNGITLCHAHHPRKKSEEARLSPYFKELVLKTKI